MKETFASGKYIAGPVLLILLYLPLSAQDSWSGDQSTPSVQSAAAEPAVSDGTNPYVVKRWDTLWDLAGKYMSDPFRWKEIWQVNPYVQNPDLIYPGNKLILPPYSPSASNVSNTGGTGGYGRSRGFLEPGEVAAESAGSAAESAQSASAGGLQTGIADIAGSLDYREFFSPEFMARIGYLVFDKDATGKIYPGNGVLDDCKPTAIYRQFDSLSASTYGDASYREGDTIDIIHPQEFVKFGTRTAHLVRPVARARVSYASGKELQAKIFKAWDVINCRDRIAPKKRFSPIEIDSIYDPSNEIIATVFQRVEETQSPFLFQTFIIASGASEGVQMGDLFLVYTVDKKTAVDDHPSMLACVVNLQDQASTLVIVKMFANRLNPGDQAKLVKRMRFR
jgi:hypothetical protein